jgi:hypothetical protein
MALIQTKSILINKKQGWSKLPKYSATANALSIFSGMKTCQKLCRNNFSHFSGSVT